MTAPRDLPALPHQTAVIRYDTEGKWNFTPRHGPWPAGKHDLYTADQMRDYARAALAATPAEAPQAEVVAWVSVNLNDTILVKYNEHGLDFLRSGHNALWARYGKDRPFVPATDADGLLEDLVQQLDGLGIPDWHGAEGLALDGARAYLAGKVPVDDVRIAYTHPGPPPAAAPAVRELVEAGKALSFAAQITGGTAGRDDGLVAAIDRFTTALANPALRTWLNENNGGGTNG